MLHPVAQKQDNITIMPTDMPRAISSSLKKHLADHADHRHQKKDEKSDPLTRAEFGTAAAQLDQIHRHH